MMNPGITPSRVVRFIVGDGAGRAFRLTHNLGTQFVLVQVIEARPPFQAANATVERTSADTVTIGFVDPPLPGEYAVVIVG